MCCCRRIITRARKVVRLVGVTYYLLGHGVMAAHETLTLTVLVRTQVPQPIKTHRRRELHAESSRWVNKRVKLLQHLWRTKTRQFDAGHKGLRLADNDKNLKSRSALDVKIEVCDYCRPIRGIALYRGLEQR